MAIETLNRDLEAFYQALAAARGVRLASNMQAVARLPEQLRQVVAAVAEGRVRTPPYEVPPLERAGEAQRRLQAGGVRGKLLLRDG